MEVVQNLRLVLPDNVIEVIKEEKAITACEIAEGIGSSMIVETAPMEKIDLRSSKFFLRFLIREDFVWEANSASKELSSVCNFPFAAAFAFADSVASRPDFLVVSNGASSVR